MKSITLNKKCLKCFNFFSGVQECLFTISGIRIIPNCPCFDCLIHVVCKTPCNILKEKAYENNPSIYNKETIYTM